ncbi:MAG: HD domain-containing protein [Thermoguttaceae bacterium]|nr:HD domain-containing protein [Thermoguttaceae bacterium]
MGHHFVNQLQERDHVKGDIYQLTEYAVRTNKNGGLYLQLTLSDKTGGITARRWNATEDLAGQFSVGDFVCVDGTVQIFNNALQMIVTEIDKADTARLDLSIYLRESQINVPELTGRLNKLLGTLTNPDLINLADCFLADEKFMTKFCQAPAGVKVHHNYEGGLLEHTVTTMETARAVGSIHPNKLDAEMLLMGAFLHDIGKIEELTTCGGVHTYTDPGQLLSHLVLGIGLLERKISEAERLCGEEFPEETALALKHMIISHHGEREKGSPCVPMTVEAIALHFIDSLDSKVSEFHRIIHEDLNRGSDWTEYNHLLQRRLYKKGA